MTLRIVSRFPRHPGIPENVCEYPNGGGHESVEALQAELRRRWKPAKDNHGTHYVCDLPNGCRTLDHMTGMEQDITLEE